MNPEFIKWLEQQEYRYFWEDGSWVLTNSRVGGISRGTWNWEQLMHYIKNK